MDLTCGGKCMKVLLFIFNGLFFLAGAAMLGIGIWLMVDPNIGERFEHIAVGNDGLFKAAAITIIVVGTLILLLGFLGCCGACKESPCMLCTFVILMSFILVLEVVVAILAGVFRKEIGKGLNEQMTKQATYDVKPIMEENNSPESLAWHHMQYDLKCCGGSSYMNYKNNTAFNANSDYPVPKTCCLLKNSDPEDPEPLDYARCREEFLKNSMPTKPEQLLTTGCYYSLTDWLKQKAGILIGIAIGIAVIEILGITFACCLRNQITRKKEYV